MLYYKYIISLYRIADEKLDELIMTARRSTDKEFRKNVYYKR